MAAAKKDIHYYPSRKPLDEVGCADDATGCAGKEAVFPVKERFLPDDPAA